MIADGEEKIAERPKISGLATRALEERRLRCALNQFVRFVILSKLNKYSS